MIANYSVTTKNGRDYRWSFAECKNTDDYGNGIYIGVVAPSGDFSSIDCRYIKDYNFLKACGDYLTRYYGENLEELHLQRICKGLEER